MSFNVKDIYDKPLNFLIGSGASFGLLPTLALKVTRADGTAHTIETLATEYQNQDDRPRRTALFMHYYEQCIRPAQTMSFGAIRKNPDTASVQENYDQFVRALLTLLQRRRGVDKRCNIFTTNYDGCLPEAANHAMLGGGLDFVVNDGGRGFFRRVIEARNFQTFLTRTGIFERHQQTLPQLNLINLHGSVYWARQGDQVLVAYDRLDEAEGPLLDADVRKAVAPFWAGLAAGGPAASLDEPPLTIAQMDSFWDDYNTLPIVNPTKWKFYETVFEEHYYQMLRMLSFELERENAVLITFGFSFADEHILNLVKRSLSNPLLMVFVTCFNATEHARLKDLFSAYPNVDCIMVDDGVLDFAAFNTMLSPVTPVAADGPVVGAGP
ncbi:SIR2 family protein [Luteibacter aegosomatis]|uniref:SIR2 family protein n=1 Tax=Luteibacter aegosomatis TaxID=2911537 RepID=UPI001FF7CD69|nr:SIR2 family protein [Luteibacter aegosomatis]UPG87584.1 SIR2 family protein [Luteibacter aegosomatis]